LTLKEIDIDNLTGTPTPTPPPHKKLSGMKKINNRPTLVRTGFQGMVSSLSCLSRILPLGEILILFRKRQAGFWVFCTHILKRNRKNH
jgi:hypothetical protein